MGGAADGTATRRREHTGPPPSETLGEISAGWQGSLSQGQCLRLAHLIMTGRLQVSAVAGRGLCPAGSVVLVKRVRGVGQPALSTGRDSILH